MAWEQSRLRQTLQRRWLLIIALTARNHKLEAKLTGRRMFAITCLVQRADTHFLEHVFHKWRQYINTRKLFWAAVTIARFLARGAVAFTKRKRRESADILVQFFRVRRRRRSHSTTMHA